MGIIIEELIWDLFGKNKGDDIGPTAASPFFYG
jgi:hypothetical protein